jgi:hypothetical protein
MDHGGKFLQTMGYAKTNSSRKRNGSPLEALIELAAMMPCWLSVALAIVLYPVLHYVASQQASVPIQPGQAATGFNGYFRNKKGAVRRP